MNTFSIKNNKETVSKGLDSEMVNYAFIHKKIDKKYFLIVNEATLLEYTYDEFSKEFNAIKTAKYIIETEVRTADGKLDRSEKAQRAMKVTSSVTMTNNELQTHMEVWQKHKAKDFPAGKIIVTSFTKKGELHEQYSLCEDGKYQVICRKENPKFYLENTKL